MKLKQVRLAKGRKAKELALSIGTDEPLMSKFENYKCLPIPPMMEKLCKELECQPTDLYEKEEMYYIGSRKSTATKKKKNIYHLSVELPNEAREFFKSHIKEMGYSDITDWANQCFSRLVYEYEKRHHPTPASQSDV